MNKINKNIIFVFLLLAGCTNFVHTSGKRYSYTGLGPTAKIIFTSPYLEISSGSKHSLILQVYDGDDNCSFKSRGIIDLAKSKDDQPTLIPANQRNYFAVLHASYSNINIGSSFSKILLFSFVPENGQDYVIEHIDNPGSMRLKYYKYDSSQIKTPIEVNDIGSGFYVNDKYHCKMNLNRMKLIED